MSKKRARYKKMEALITLALCLDVVIFLAFLVFAGIGMTGLKAVTAVLCFAISGAVLYILYMTRELLRKRSIWMTLAALCTILCVLASLLLRFPAPAFVLSVI